MKVSEFAPKEINFNDYNHIRVPNNRLMIKEIPVDYTLGESKIVMSSKDPQKEFTQGVVVRIGDGFYNQQCEMVTPNFAIGDIVYFGVMAGTDFKLRRSDHFEEVKVLDVPSIYFVDGAASDLYIDVTKK